MHLTAAVDPIAERLLELRKVSGTQWLLRTIGVLITSAATVVVLPDGLASSALSVLVVMMVPAALLAQLARPDADFGLLAPAGIVLGLLGQPELGFARAALVGLLLVVAHMAWALAATLPVHGVFTRSAWALTARWSALVVAASGVGSLVVLALAGVTLGPWMVVVGILALIALFALVLPRPES